jgi:hypothetical protein
MKGAVEEEEGKSGEEKGSKSAQSRATRLQQQPLNARQGFEL